MPISSTRTDRSRLSTLRYDTFFEQQVDVPCLVTGVFVCNDGASDRYLMLFDTTTVPVDTTIPAFSVRVNSGEQLLVPLHLKCATSLTWAVSSTNGTLTADAVTFGVQVTYET
jgi:hypothetical protein